MESQIYNAKSKPIMMKSAIDQKMIE